MANQMQVRLPSGSHATFKVLGMLQWMDVSIRGKAKARNSAEEGKTTTAELIKACLVEVVSPDGEVKKITDPDVQLASVLLDTYLDARDADTLVAVLIRVHSSQEEDLGNAMATLAPIVG